MREAKRIAFVAAALLALSCDAHLTKNSSADAVRSQAARKFVGWEGVKSAMLNDAEVGDHIFGQICTGDSDWLQVAHGLRSVSDGHFGETLSSALSVALLRSPSEVLAGFGTEACVTPEYLPETCDTSNWLVRARAAIASVYEPKARATKAKCDAELNGGTP